MSSLHNFIFPVVLPFNELRFSEEETALLDTPSQLREVNLCSNWEKQSYRTLNFEGTTVREAIQKILTFYSHNTHRRLIGDHICFAGLLDIDGITVARIESI
jgi:hypothetical protein